MKFFITATMLSLALPISAFAAAANPLTKGIEDKTDFPSDIEWTMECLLAAEITAVGAKKYVLTKNVDKQYNRSTNAMPALEAELAEESGSAEMLATNKARVTTELAAFEAMPNDERQRLFNLTKKRVKECIY